MSSHDAGMNMFVNVSPKYCSAHTQKTCFGLSVWYGGARSLKDWIQALQTLVCLGMVHV
jgi:hypothetical protein